MNPRPITVTVHRNQTNQQTAYTQAAAGVTIRVSVCACMCVCTNEKRPLEVLVNRLIPVAHVVAIGVRFSRLRPYDKRPSAMAQRRLPLVQR